MPANNTSSYILGISCYFHDAAAALIKDGILFCAAEEERFTRKKHDSGFPSNAVDFCLKSAGISGNELEYVVFHEKPFVKFERIITTVLNTFPRSRGLFTEAVKLWMLDKLWIKSILAEKLGVEGRRILFIDHHMSHAAGAFLCSPFDKAALLTVDGVGEWATACIGRGGGSGLRLDREIRFPDSLGLLYSVFTSFLGFEVNEGEYKVMGMAPYGRPVYEDRVLELISVRADGSFSLDMSYLKYDRSLTCGFSKKFEKLFGPPRRRSAHAFDMEGNDRHYADIAASIQKVTEDVVVKMAAEAHKATGLDALCLGGGVALNCVANTKILQNTPFSEIFILPAPGDSGSAVGAALYVWNSLMGNKREFVMSHAYYGGEYPDEYIRSVLDRQGVAYEYCAGEDELTEKVSNELANGKVVGWFQGRSEFGPRALGNRSILADPRKGTMKDLINSKVKFREEFRPFAPSVPVEHAAEYFELPRGLGSYPARFMLFTAKVRADRRELLPAVTHVDGSSRVQVVYRETNPRFHSLIKAFGAKTGINAILNTSFNLKGEPIVQSPEDALRTFGRSGLDALALGKFMIRK